MAGEGEKAGRKGREGKQHSSHCSSSTLLIKHKII